MNTNIATSATTTPTADPGSIAAPSRLAAALDAAGLFAGVLRLSGTFSSVSARTTACRLASRRDSCRLARLARWTQHAAPRPAATVILARDRPDGDAFEVLMLLRNLNSDFIGGAYVFPGGAVDPQDATDEANALCVGLDDERASSLLGIDSGGLAYWVACLRELFEEAGLLLAVGADGTPLDMADAEVTARLRGAPTAR